MAAPNKATHQEGLPRSFFTHGNHVWLVLIGLLTLRLVNAFTIHTFFQPDEYFQSLEPAWQIAFGRDSGAWITWEWREQLRSSLHPMLFAAVYRAAARLCDTIQATPGMRAEVLIAAPKVLQACIAAVGDFFTWRLARKVYGLAQPASLAALVLTAISPWQWFCSVRTLSNALETTLTIVALNFWPWTWFERQHPAGPTVKDEASPAGLDIALTAAAIACILRPTNIVIWAIVALTCLYRYGDLHKTTTLSRHALICGSAVLAVSVGVDRTYYGMLTFPPLKFLYFNVVQSLSVFYGANRPDYYFTEGLPLLLTTALPFAAVGIWQAFRPEPARPALQGYEERQSRFVLLITVLVTVMTMTLISHKEVRFIYPLLPILHILAAKPLAAFFNPFPLPASRLRRSLMVLMLSVNICIAAYVSLVHQRGVIDVLHYLRHEQNARLVSSSSLEGSASSVNVTVGFFMPCHSTPWRSHLVYPEIHAWALTCEPPLNVPIQDRASYQDEADLFYAHPTSWIDNNMADRNTVLKVPSIGSRAHYSPAERREWPEYLVFFQILEPVIVKVLEDTSYRECWRGFNTQWHDDRRRQGDVVVWCLRS
ncbi:hypothetical protein LTR36_005146 [Oleoguttula mirabilis]|uniref:Mannosyltransferase n=1 Tax=Oleoguttula mirabilis TaxID=1507867 RepID=A0AAV9JW70_9PEZI|nr:hypothetical protein LTR36_005146 [Oleoguttula mirabilis]